MWKTAAGACGLQNSPPGSWELALFNRVADCSLAQLEEARLLEYGQLLASGEEFLAFRRCFHV